MHSDYHVELIDLPTSIRSFVKKTCDSYVIVINSRISDECQKKCYKHELQHIRSEDFERSCSADEIEQERHSE